MKRYIKALIIIFFSLLVAFLTLIYAEEPAAIDQETVKAEIDNLLIPLQPRAEYSIVKICGPINNLCAVAVNPPYREFPNVFIFKYDIESGRYIRVFEGLCLGLQDEPSGILDLHTVGMGIDTILNDKNDEKVSFDSDTLRKFIELSAGTGMVAIPYQEFVHLQGPTDIKRSYIIDKTNFYDLALKLFGDVYQNYPRQDCTMYDMPDLTDLQLSYQDGSYLITGITANRQKWEVSFSGIDSDKNFLLQKKVNAEKYDGEPADEYEALLEKAGAESDDNPKSIIAILNKAKELNPKNPQAYFLAGNLYYKMGDTKKAGAEYQEALNLSSVREKKKYISRLNATTTFFKSQKESDLLKKGYDAIETDKPKEAIKILNKALKLNPANVRIYYEMGYAYIELNDVSKAITYLEKGRAIHPAYNYILNELKYAYSEQGDIVRLKMVVDDLLKYYGETPELYQELGFAYYSNDMVDMAIDSLETNIQKFPDYYISYYSLGQIYYLTKNYSRAKELLNIFVDKATPNDLGDNSDSFEQYREKALFIINQCNAEEAQGD